MSRVLLDLDGGEQPVGPDCRPQSITLSRGAVELAAGLTGVLLPSQETPPPPPPSSHLETALGPVRSPAAQHHDGETQDAARELHEAGLLTGTTEDPQVPAPLAGLLALLAGGTVRVDADLVIRRRAARHGSVRLRSWHRRHAGRFASMSTADASTVELMWGPVATWAHALTRLATVTAEPAPGQARPPAALVELPWDLLLATGRALSERREDLLDALVHGAGGTVRIADDPAGPARSATEAETTAQLRLLHRASCGHLQATVGGIGSSGRRVLGVVSWSLFPDGWRSLTPAPGEGARVLIRASGPELFAAQVAAHAAGVRS